MKFFAKFLMALTLIAVVSVNVWAADDHFTGFVKISSGKELYVNWAYAKPGQPTVVLLNGLTYSVTSWDKLTAELVKKGVGVLRYDPIGMGKTLLKYAPATEIIKIQDQVSDLKSLLTNLKLAKPYSLVGLSYGGGLGLEYAGTYPKDVGQMIAMAPYTEALQQQDQYIKQEVATTRLMEPWNPSTDDQLYDYFLEQLVYATYPSAEPSTLDNSYILGAVFHMTQGIRKMNIDTFTDNFPAQSIHLIIAGNDQYIPRNVLTEFWKKLPTSVKLSKTIIENSEHKMPDAVPIFTADVIHAILTDPTLFSGGREFDANPLNGVVKYDGGKLQLPKEN